MNPINRYSTGSLDRLRAPDPPSAPGRITVDGNRISWPNDGWYEVQSATSFNTLQEGGQSATLPAGQYNLINHSTGERFENVSVGPQFDNNLASRDGSRPFEPTDVLDKIRNPDINIEDIDNPGNPDNPGATGVLVDPTGEFKENAPGFGLGAAIADGTAARPEPKAPPPPTTTSSTIFGEGTDNETHVITTTTPDTTAPTSNQPFTNVREVINPTGTLLAETTVTTPTGMEVRQSGSNGVNDGNSVNRGSSENDRGSSSQNNTDFGDRTSKPGGMGGV